MSGIQDICVILIAIFGIAVNIFGWTFAELDNIKRPGLLFGVLLVLDIGIFIVLFLGLFGVFG